MTAPPIGCCWLRTPESASGARVRGYNANPGYFFFLGFLTSFFGLLSLAMCDPPLQMDYNRCAQESEGRSRAGALEDAGGQVVRGNLWVRGVGTPPLAPVDARTLWVARSLTSCSTSEHSLPGQGTGGPAPWALHLAPCLLRQ